MRDRSFIIAVALVGALALLIVAGNIRDAAAPLYGPPNVDEKEVMSKVKEGRLSFDEARFYSAEDRHPAATPAGSTPDEPADGGSLQGAGGDAQAGADDDGKRDK